jgi:hypothetical protein
MLLLVACQDPADSENSPHTWRLGDIRSCQSPIEGIFLSEEGEERGLTGIEGDPTVPIGYGTVIAEDLDADGDLDLLYMDKLGAPVVYANDGSGYFTEVFEPILPTPTGITLDPEKQTPPAMVADLDGDDLPELFMFGGGTLMLLPNLGGLKWQLQEPILQEEGDFSFMAITAGDLDGDNDLDLVVPAGGEAAGDPGGPARVLKNEEGIFKLWQWLPEDQSPQNVQAPLITDIDGDGDLDIYLANDLAGISTLWLNESGEFVEAASQFGLSLDQAGMGMDSADLNEDGRLDYCFSNVGPMLCLLSSPAGGFYEGAQALGLVPEEKIGHSGTIGWSIELVDLENDGDLDALQASGEQGQVEEEREGPIYQDLLWEGEDGFFIDATEKYSFGDTTNHVGMVAADFNGDGSLEVVLGNPEMRPLFYQSHCTEGAWLVVDPAGPLGNRAGIGVKVVLEAGGKTQVRELYALRSHGQGPSELHFGLGEVEQVDRLTVYWPDGSSQSLEAFEPRRVLSPVWGD